MESTFKIANCLYLLFFLSVWSCADPVRGVSDTGPSFCLPYVLHDPFRLSFHLQVLLYSLSTFAVNERFKNLLAASHASIY